MTNTMPQGTNRIQFKYSITTVLIVEKEARFPEIVLVTGKGYPDINTREILQTFAKNLKVLVLVDYNPDGAHIYQVYAEGGWSQQTYGIAHAKWVGLHCSMSRIEKWGLNLEWLIEFTARDRNLAIKLIQHWVNNKQLRRITARMLYRGKKAEIESITQYREMLQRYVTSIVENLSSGDHNNDYDHDQAYSDY
ncbi:endodeoxyribonuclease [Coemansia sp. RSA 485]|nr:endodeoxyribonuclease [Coemansia sp. RSA 485]